MCPADGAAPRGCAGSERYALFDVQTREIVVRREAARYRFVVE